VNNSPARRKSGPDGSSPAADPSSLFNHAQPRPVPWLSCLPRFPHDSIPLAIMTAAGIALACGNPLSGQERTLAVLGSPRGCGHQARRGVCRTGPRCPAVPRPIGLPSVLPALGGQVNEVRPRSTAVGLASVQPGCDGPYATVRCTNAGANLYWRFGDNAKDMPLLLEMCLC
jgi:hypothetical protein